MLPTLPFRYLLVQLSLSPLPRRRPNGAPDASTTVLEGETWELRAYPANLFWNEEGEEWRMMGRREVALWRALQRRAQRVTARAIPDWARRTIEPGTAAAGPVTLEWLGQELAYALAPGDGEEMSTLLAILFSTQLEAEVTAGGARRTETWRPLEAVAYGPGEGAARLVMVQFGTVVLEQPAEAPPAACAKERGTETRRVNQEKPKPAVKRGRRANGAKDARTNPRKRTLLPEFAALIAAGPKTDVQADLDAVRGDR